MRTKPIGDRWGDALRKDREQALEVCVQAWEQSGETSQRGWSSAFSVRSTGGWTGGRLTGADVFYLAVRSLAAELGDRLSAEAWLLGDRAQPHVPVYWFLSTLHLEGANLSDAQLERAVLLEAHLEGTNLSGANLQEAGLDGAHLERACLADANLCWADLVAADLTGADLSRAHLDSALLTNALLAGANLDGTYLDGAIIEQAHLGGTDLKRTVAPEGKRWMGWRHRRKRDGA